MKAIRLITTLSLLSALLAGCGSGDDATAPTPPPAPPPPAAVVDPLDLPTAGVLSSSGVQESGLNPAGLAVHYTMAGATFGDDVEIQVNGTPTPTSAITRGANDITAQLALADGRNTIAFKAFDDAGRPVFKQQVIWSGAHTLEVRLVDAQGQPFAQAAQVSLTLADDASIGASAAATNAGATFSNLPARTVLVQARTPGNLVGVAGGLGSDGVITVRMLDFVTASTVANNDFSQGVAGWNVSAGAASVVAHAEDVGPVPGATPQAKPSSAGPRRERVASPNKQILAKRTSVAPGDDPDLQLDTLGEGSQTLSRTFAVAPGTTSVVVRYRFITSEVPGGFFGSEYNDFFSVAIRSKTKGLVASESNTMNGLGLAAFNVATGSTAWRTVTIATDPTADEVQVDIAVANVADGLYDSSVIVDYVAERTDRVIPTLAWNPTDGGLTLRYKVESGPLTEAVTIRVHWASGTTAASAIGAAMFTLTVPAGTATGDGPATAVKGDFLSSDPAGVTHLVAVGSDTAVSAVADVQVGFGANADASAVPATMLDIVRDAQRAAGTVNATITSTARSPADQARAMFNNLVNPGNTRAVNVQNQLNLYAAPGDAVVNVFSAQADGKTAQQVLDNATTIKAAMEAEIVAQGPANVSKHCADPATRSVVDVGASAFAGSTTAANAFKTTATARVDKFIDEISTNNAYHLELAVAN